MNLLLAYLLTYLRDGQGHTRCRFHGSTGQSVLASTLTAATRALFHRAKKAVARCSTTLISLKLLLEYYYY